MGHHQQCHRPAPPQELSEPRHCFDVEVVRGLIEQQHVGIGKEQRREFDPAPFAAGQRRDAAFPHGVVGRSDAEQRCGHLPGGGVGGPLVISSIADHCLPHGGLGIACGPLREEADARAGGDRYPAGVRLYGAPDDAEQRALTSPVAANDADAVARCDPEGDLEQHRFMPERDAGGLNVDQVARRHRPSISPSAAAVGRASGRTRELAMPRVVRPWARWSMWDEAPFRGVEHTCEIAATQRGRRGFPPLHA